MQNGYKNLHTHITETLQIIQNVSDAANEQMVGINQVSQKNLDMRFYYMWLRITKYTKIIG